MNRRSVLASLACVGVGTGLAGCPGGSDRVSVLAAGSLQNALHDIGESITRDLAVEAHGSTRCARLVADGQRDPDLLALADPQLFDGILNAPWHARFAGNAVVLAYNPKTGGGQRVGKAERWYEPLLGSDRTDGGRGDGGRGTGVRLGRTDPELDPLGYRTLFALRLAADHYGDPNLPSRVLGPNQRYPETQLLARFDTGAVDAAFVYRNMAVERDYPFRELPPEVDLSEPEMADEYASVDYTLGDGTTVRGEPISYAARLRHRRPVSEAVFETILSAARYLEPHGFTVRDRHPTYVGDVPRALGD